MTTGKLPADLSLGRIQLTISNLERAVTFYRESIGLYLLERSAGLASLGVPERELVRLIERPEARRTARRTGLYHFALRVPTRNDLGQVLRHLVSRNVRLTGGADHLVSEALYLDDPDGNGIEIYRDRPRDEWPISDGRPQMDTLPLDYEGLLANSGSTAGDRFHLPEESDMGHMHLHVAHLPEAVAFYREVLGFDLQMMFGAMAAFLAVGGYHHHIGLNTWAGIGALPPPENAIGMQDFVINLPTDDALMQLVQRLRDARHAFEHLSGGLSLRDPSQNKILFLQR